MLAINFLSFHSLSTCNIVEKNPEIIAKLEKENARLTTLLTQYQEKEHECEILDSLYIQYWQRLENKKYEMDEYKIRPDFGLDLSALLNECDTVTKLLIKSYFIINILNFEKINIFKIFFCQNLKEIHFLKRLSI